MLTNRLLILVVTVNTIVSMLLLKYVVAKIGAPAGLAGLPQFFAKVVFSPLVYVSLLLQVLGYSLWIIVLSQERLGIAVAFSGASFYVLMALFAWFLFGEQLAVLQWIGVSLITAGVLCMTWQP